VRHRARRAAATLVLRKDAAADRYGAIEISAGGRIERFLKYEAPSIASAGPLEKFMFTGVQIVEPVIFDLMAEESSRRFGTTTSTYPKMLMRGLRLDGYVFDGFWQDLGTPDRIAEAEAKLAAGAAKLSYL